MVPANPPPPAEDGPAVGGSLTPHQQQHHHHHHQQQGGNLGMPGLAGGLMTIAAAAAASPEDVSKKIRKPYTITKSRESWTEQEHDKFLEALQLFDRDWKKIEAFIGSKTVIQIRSHAQKYFIKVQKNGTTEHVPPPRPKRKAAHPYPQKASKNALPLNQSANPFQVPCSLLEEGYPLRTDTPSMLSVSTTGATVSSWAHCAIHPLGADHMAKEDIGPGGAIMSNNCCSSTVESPRGLLPQSDTNDHGSQVPPLRVMPDFVQVYKFLGSVFYPSTNDHLQKLHEMDPIDVETVLLLMRNLSINLSSPDFENHKILLSEYDAETVERKAGSLGSYS